MASIYEYSTITLAATFAEDSRSGCFVDPPLWMQGYITDGKEKIPAYEDFAVREFIEKTPSDKPLAFVRGDTHHLVPDRTASVALPLLTRRWVYQERLLSPRVLHFGEIDLMYECNEGAGRRYCRKWHHSYSRHVIAHPVKSQHVSALLYNSTGASAMAGFAGRWGRVIEEYSAMNLTYSKDRLPAIAGLAKQASRVLKDSHYINGMWHASFAANLSWKRRDHPATLSADRNRPGPSWTWITMPGAVSFPHGWHVDSEIEPRVIGQSFEYTDNNFMQPVDGSVKLRGKLVPARLRALHVKPDYSATEERRYCVVRLGRKPNESAQLDHYPTDAELETEWYPIRPR